MADNENPATTAPAAPATPPAPPAAPAHAAPPATPPAAPAAASGDVAAQLAAAQAALQKAQDDATKWKDLSRKHERRHLEALGFPPDKVDELLEQRKTNPTAVADKVAGYDDLAARLKKLEEDRDQARSEAEVAKAAAKYGVKAEDIVFLEGRTGDDLKSMAERLAQPKAVQATSPAGVAGNNGTPVSGPPQIATREQYIALSPEERKKAREDGRLDQLLGRK